MTKGKIMSDSTAMDPYAGNILTAGLGPLRSRKEVMQCLTELPIPPKSMSGVPAHIALHLLMELRDFHLPSNEEGRLQETMELMVRPIYRYLDPTAASTWSHVSGEKLKQKRQKAPPFGAACVGHSGTGKTEAISRCLELYPAQVIHHKSFPRVEGGHKQLIYLSAEVPSSGKMIDVAEALMRATDAATGNSRFTGTLARERRRDGMQMLNEWQQVAVSHFLGVLHLDEVQNFFKLPSLDKRRQRKEMNGVPELSIVEDQCLKGILNLMNTSQFALLFSGTPDGIGALMRRLSNTARIAMSGYHLFNHFENTSDFKKIFLANLGKYQYVEKRIPVDDELASLIIEITGGIQRLIIALWIAAHRVALERNTGDLRLADFKYAADTYLAPVGPAVAALRSKDPKRMSKYEDLLGGDSMFWPQFWNSVSRL